MLKFRADQMAALEARARARELARLARTAGALAEALDTALPEGADLGAIQDEAKAAGLSSVDQAAALAVLRLAVLPELTEAHRAWAEAVWRDGAGTAAQRLETVFRHLEAGRHHLEP